MFKSFYRNLQLENKEFITVEITPPHGASAKKIIEEIENIKLYKYISGFSVTDNPLARLKMSSILTAIQIQNSFKKPVIATMSMRDQNKLSLQSILLGANDFNLRIILALTGDPAKISDQPEVKGVLERDSTLLLSIIHHLNRGVDYSTKKLSPKPKEIYPFAVSNSYSRNMKQIEKKMIKKLNYGAIAIITQPTYDINNAKELIDIFNYAKEKSIRESAKKATLILGQFPIITSKTAIFLSDNVPGIKVPKDIIDDMALASISGLEEEAKVGLEISKNLFKSIRKIHPKIHLMTHNNFNLCKQLILD